ncbi:hypothetical protein Lal_00036141 [Lupinus albus]|uniref:Putative spo11/DNA topoisomerase VI subunit A, DNA topoisomerase VI, subunit A n=1 Tax=Lupinus albus TaxID=3870 RepID=A0A6A5M9A7_LUPAL|nr:putative spo11/DNA topoisomerase VI subunit A, DNA topoisomerase VI, subunit A [Lupinus albus]KAF1868703.1 hypothetical protein Lal_00036141 [Lupinus albus]
MEGKMLRSHIVSRIKEFTGSLLLDLTNGRSPTILIHRFTNYCTNPISNCCCGSDFPSGKGVLLTFSKASHLHRLGIFTLPSFITISIYTLTIYVMLRVLLIVQKLLQENKHSSKRDIYYMHPSVFLGGFSI